MHIYVYDEHINKKRYDKILARIETRLTDLGLNGKIIRLGVMKNIQNAVENEIKRGAKTIIAVGNDKTLNDVINAIIGSEKNIQSSLSVPVGIIPVNDKNNQISTSLGVPTREDACDVLSARRIEKIDLGAVNYKKNNTLKTHYFLSQASINSKNTTIEIFSTRLSQNKYSIEILEAGRINIINAPLLNNQESDIKSNPHDGVLELQIEVKKNKLELFSDNKKINKQSFFSIKKISVINPDTPLVLDNNIKIPTPVEIGIIKNKLNLIVGKNRTF